jgi:hypothetical protein
VVNYLLPQLLEALRRSGRLEQGQALLGDFAAATRATCKTFGGRQGCGPHLQL